MDTQDKQTIKAALRFYANWLTSDKNPLRDLTPAGALAEAKRARELADAIGPVGIQEAHDRAKSVDTEGV